MSEQDHDAWITAKVLQVLEKIGEQHKDCSAVDKIKKAAGLPVKFRPFHGLRHHFAVTLANSGKFTLDIIAEMLTHKNA